ncbi:MAG: gas vesicle protein K [Deltaproteobacteria bacterium]|nr:gas vesicle protein K [Deltaproteobacteria bacterium]
MEINIDGKDLKQGVTGLVIAVVEVLKEALKHQAVRRMESGALSEAEVERLGAALMGIDKALDEIKEDCGVKEAVQSVREGLDRAINDLLSAAARSTKREPEVRKPYEMNKRLHGEENPEEIKTL